MSVELTKNTNSTDLININIPEDSPSRITDFKNSAIRTNSINPSTPMKKRNTVIDINFDTDNTLDYKVTDLKDKMELTYMLSEFLTKPIIIFFFGILLIYHIIIYTYLGILKGGNAFNTGFMYSTNYLGVLVSYWILCRQDKKLLSWSHIISRELINNFQTIKQRDFNQYELINENQKHNLTKYPSGYNSFIRYCMKWECNLKLILYAWQGLATCAIVLKIIGIWEQYFGESFDDDILGLYGYYNLFGQYISSTIIVTSAATMFCGFYNLQCVILSYAGLIRQYRLQKENKMIRFKVNHIDDIIKDNYTKLRDKYLYVQKCCILLGDVWSTPVIVSIFFCTQVIISNIFVIQNQLNKCKKECSLFIIFPFIWSSVAMYIMCMILQRVSAINDATSEIKQAFICSTWGLFNTDNMVEEGGDYKLIGGRKNWIDYLESNPIQMKISGMVITKKYVINSITTIGIGLSSFIFSNVLK
tara:strand:- start:778 stop:2199 length:1422 start_codon:yes stop_codon:yes gene_type:complete